MPSPFPGMDPYLEEPSLWADVHGRLANTIADQLQPRLAPRYTARLTPYVAYETIDLTRRSMVPDVGVFDRNYPSRDDGGVAVAPAPLTGMTTMDFPTRYHRIDIRSTTDGTLVTAIEILSPVNKRPGEDGYDTYHRKRRDIFRSEVHLLEIDLLRAGRRPKIERPELPDAAYFIFLSRANRRPEVEIWPILLSAPLPRLPVPLQYPDRDVPLDLNRAIIQIYNSARYDLDLDYRLNPPAPDLSPDDATWLDEHLRAAGLR